MEVKLVRLIDGTDVIASVTAFGDPLVLDHVSQLAMQQDEETGQVAIGLAPLHPLLKDNKLSIEQSKIVFIADVEDEFRNRFAAQHGGIITPPAGQVISP